MAGAGAVVAVHTLGLQAQTPDPLANYPFPKMDPSWVNIDPAIANVPLTETEIRALINYKINTGILSNDDAMRNLKQNLKRRNVDIPFGVINILKWAALPRFADNLVKELQADDPWNRGPDDHAMTVGNVWRKTIERGSVHFHVDDIKAQLKNIKSGKPADNDSGFIRFLGPPAQWRGNLPVDVMAKLPDDKKAIETFARHRPPLNFPKIIPELGLSLGVLKITPDDLQAIGIRNIAQRLKCNCTQPPKAVAQKPAP